MGSSRRLSRRGCERRREPLRAPIHAEADDEGETQFNGDQEPRNFRVTPGIDNRLIEEPTETPSDEVIDCHERLRGRLKHYHRITATSRFGD